MKENIEKGEIEKVKQLLLKMGIDTSDNHLRTALIWATFYNNIALLSWLIDNGANINHQDINGYCALHFAGQQRTIQSAKLLIEKGANLELADSHGNTPLWTAIFNSNKETELVRLYVKSGANLDHINKFQNTPRKLAETIAGFDLSSIK